MLQRAEPYSIMTVLLERAPDMRSDQVQVLLSFGLSVSLCGYTHRVERRSLLFKARRSGNLLFNEAGPEACVPITWHSSTVPGLYSYTLPIALVAVPDFHAPNVSNTSIGLRVHTPARLFVCPTFTTSALYRKSS